MPEFLDSGDGRRLAYSAVAPAGPGAALPGVVFLCGFRSDMTGTKAQYLDAWARRQGRAFLRFDYTGHGQSSGSFLDGAIGDWAEDAATAVAALTDGPQVLVGSSMGGWIALLLARRMPARVAGLVGVAAAPDFTEDAIWPSLGEAGQQAVMREGSIALPSQYDETPLVITRRLIEDGRQHLVLRESLPLPFPVRLLQGSEDEDVDVAVGLRLLAHAGGADIRLTIVKGADHRFSSPANLAHIAAAIEEVSRGGAGA